mgnify:CR=1 FL=1
MALAASSVNLKQRLTPMLMFGDRTRAVPPAAARIVSFCASLKPVVPITMRLPALAQASTARSVASGAAPAQAGAGSIVADLQYQADTGETLIGANIYVKDNPAKGGTTNAYGFYSLTLPAGEYTLNDITISGSSS